MAEAGDGVVAYFYDSDVGNFHYGLFRTAPCWLRARAENTQ